MNRHERRAAKAGRITKISELKGAQRKIMLALIKNWVETSPMGRRLQDNYSVEEAVSHICELHERGLVGFVSNGGDIAKGEFSFRVEPVLPRSMLS